MLRLRTFGGLSLEDENGPLTGAPAQRRRLALLALLAGAGERGISRVKLVVYFWPESDTERAHHALAQLLYVVRRSLPADPIAGSSAELRLDPGVVCSDVGEFERLLEAGEREQAVALYEGSFLDGFHLGGAPEFERWAEEERFRLAGRAAAAMEALAKDAAARGDRARAVHWWQKRAALDPLDSWVTVELMRALDAAGNRPGALQHARVHEALLREDLGAAPDPAVLALAQRLREAPAGGEPDSSGARLEGEETGGVAASDDARAVLGESGARTARYRAAAWTVGALLGLLLVLLAGTRATRESIPAITPAAPSSSVIAVLPFAVHGDPRFAYLGEGMLDLLSINLDGAGELRTVDPRALLSLVARDSSRVIDPERGRAVAARFGAGRYVLGEVVEAGGRLRITASLYDPSRGLRPVAQAMVEGEAAELFRLVDELTAELIAGQYDTPDERLARSAAVTTHSLPALKAYLEGEAQLRAGRYGMATEAFQRAVAEDTSFALAYYRLAVAADWFGRIDQSVEVSERAMRHRDRLSEHDRLLVEAYHAFRHGAAGEAEGLYRTVVGAYPDDLEAWYQLGEILFHSNPPRGRSFTESRGAFERVLSFEADHHGAVMHMVRVAAYEGKRAELDSLIERALPLTPPSERLELRALRAFNSGNRADQDRIIEELRTAADGVLWHTAWRTTVYARNLAGAERTARLLVDTARPPHAQAQGFSVLIPLLVGQGRLRAARAEVQGARAQRLNTFSGIRAHWAAFRFLPANRAEIIEIRGQILRQDASINPDKAVINRFNTYGGVYPQERVYQLGLLSARLGEDAEARARARELDAMGVTPEARALSRYFAAVIRADLARSRNRPREALAFLEQAPVAELPMDLLGAFGAQTYAAWMRAELLRELGHPEAALAWYASRAQVEVQEAMYLAPAHFRQGEIYERLGDRRRAIEHYRRFVELWKDADPELQPMLSEGKRRLARLRGQAAKRGARSPTPG